MYFLTLNCMFYVCVLSHSSCVWLSVTLWTVAHQAPLFMRFSKQEYWSGLPFPPLGNLPNPGIEPASLSSPALAGRFFTTSATWELFARHCEKYFWYYFIKPSWHYKIKITFINLYCLGYISVIKQSHNPSGLKLHLFLAHATRPI